MFSASLVVAVLLSASGDAPKIVNEAPEQEVRGVANPELATPALELQYLKRTRPSLDWSGALVGVGGVVTGVGAALIILAFATAASSSRAGRNEGGGYIILVGLPVAGLGAALGIGGGIAMGVVGAELTRIDARIRALEGQLAPPPSARIPIIPPVVLARF